MIEHTHIDQRECVLEPFSDLFVGHAWFSYTRGMIVCKDHSSCIIVDNPMYDHTWIDTGAVNGAVKQFLEREYAVAIIQEQAGENFMWTGLQLG